MHGHLFRRYTLPVSFNALAVPSLTTCTFSRSIGVFTRWLIQHFTIFCDHLSRPLIWRDFPFHTSLDCSETVRRWCHWTQILFPSLLFICALVYFFAVDCSLHKAVNSTGRYCFASICRGRWFGTSLHVWSRTSVSPVFFSAITQELYKSCLF